MNACLPLALLVVVASALAGQHRASHQIDSAYAQVRAGRLDSAEALLRPLLDSSTTSKPEEHASALVVYGIVEFFRGSDSAAAQAFQGALEIRLDLRGDWMFRVDSSLGRLWRRERTRAICGMPEPVAIDFLAADTAGVGSRASVLTERPAVLSGPMLRYPERLRRAGVQGRVVVAGVIDTTGLVEPRSIKVVESPHPDFNGQATKYLDRAKFRPGRIGTRPVRVCVEVPLDFRIRQ